MKKSFFRMSLIATLILSFCGTAFASSGISSTGETWEELQALKFVETQQNQENVSRLYSQADSADLPESKVDEWVEEDRQIGAIIERFNDDASIDYVALTSSLSENPSDRRLAMFKMVEIYNQLTDSVEQDKIKNYIIEFAPVAGDTELIAFADSLKEESNKKSAGLQRGFASLGYQPGPAYRYAQQYTSTDSNAEIYNSTSYPYFAGNYSDCANFISQALLAGGMSMQDNWYIYRKNTNYSRVENATQLNNSWNLSDPSPWISAREFTTYWSGRCTKYLDVMVTDYKANSSTYYSMWPVMGDVVLLMEPYAGSYRGSHVMMITAYNTSTRDFKYSAHSGNRQDYDLMNAANSSTYAKYKLRFLSFVGN